MPRQDSGKPAGAVFRLLPPAKRQKPLPGSGSTSRLGPARSSKSNPPRPGVLRPRCSDSWFSPSPASAQSDSASLSASAARRKGDGQLIRFSHCYTERRGEPRAPPPRQTRDNNVRRPETIPSGPCLDSRQGWLAANLAANLAGEQGRPSSERAATDPSSRQSFK
jgi:hypothetical protein